MDWQKVVVHTTTMGADLVSELLIGAGAVGTQVVDRYDVLSSEKKDGMWDMIDEEVLAKMPEDVEVVAYYPPEKHLSEIQLLINERLSPLRASGADFDIGTLQLDMSQVRDEDWSQNWKKYYKPTRIGNRLVVCPTWEKYSPEPDDLVIVMDPGMAFGTGTHETTSMCMEQLEYYVKPDMTCIDVGCGSGILAIAAARLGAKDVLAIDLDQDAVEVAKKNIELNQISDTVRAVHGDLLEHQEEKADIIVANIIADVVCYLCSPAKAHLNDNGIFICSGIIREREQDVQNALAQAGYIIDRRLEKGEWVCLAARLK